MDLVIPLWLASRCATSAPAGAATVGSTDSVDEALEEVDVLDEVAIARNSSRTRYGRRLAEAAAIGVLQHQPPAVLEPDEIVGVVQQHPALAVDDLVLDAADREATTGRPFHIGSVTVSPNPRPGSSDDDGGVALSALTTWAFSSRSSIGRRHR